MAHLQDFLGAARVSGLGAFEAQIEGLGFRVSLGKPGFLGSVISYLGLLFRPGKTGKTPK